MSFLAQNQKNSLDFSFISCYFQSTEGINLKLVWAHEVELRNWRDAFTALPATKQVVLNDEAKKMIGGTKCVIKFCKMGGGKTIKAPCQHYNVRMLGMTMSRKEFLAMSCGPCGKIRLLNVQTEKVTEVYNGEWAANMCIGEPNTIFVGLRSGVTEFECSPSKFKEKKGKIKTEVDAHAGFCYVPGLKYLVICGHINGRREIRALSCQDSSVVWRIQGLVVGGSEMHPIGVVFCQDLGQGQGRLFSVDRLGRMFVIDPNNGLVLQTIEVTSVRCSSMCICADQIVMLSDRNKISYFSID